MVDTAVILAAGRGTRLQPYTFEIPKGLIKVGDMSLIERSISILKSHGIKEIIIGCGHLSDHYEKLARELGFKTYLNEEFATTGSFHTLYEGRSLINKDFLLLESDLLYDAQAIHQILSSNHPNIILCSGFTQSNDEVFVEIKNGLLKKLSKKRDHLKTIDAELVGIWKISLALFDKLLDHHQTAADAASKDYEHAIADISNEQNVHALVDRNLVWCEIDSEQHLERAKKKILPNLT